MERPSEKNAADLQSALADAQQRFLTAVKDLRPRLHRFCSRMVGSVLDGGYLIQETLAQAFYSLSFLADPSRFEPWLFRIAHNKCVDFLRRTGRPEEGTMPYDEELEWPDSRSDEPLRESIDEALVTLVSSLPPMERACVLLKDVLDYQLTEIAEIVDSTIGGVKAALHRGRGKLHAARSAPTSPRMELDQDERTLLEQYIDCFNRRDWVGLGRLIQADARLEVVGASEGTPPSTYFHNYTKLSWDWRFTLGRVDGIPLVVLLRKDGDQWKPHSAVRLLWRNGRIARIRDYVHVGYLLNDSFTELEGN